MEKLLFTRVSSQGFEPVKATELSAGFDLKSAYNYTIPPFGRQLCLTDIKIALPNNTYGRIAGRSSLAILNHITVAGGVIDQDFRGIIGIILFNHSSKSYDVKRGHRIAQLIIEKIQPVILEEVSFLPLTVWGMVHTGVRACRFFWF